MVGGGPPVTAVARHAVLRGLDAEDAAEGGRDADGAAAVAAGGDGAQPGCQGRARAAAGAAGSAGGVPGVAAGFAHLVLGGARLPELRGVGLAQHDGAGGLDALHHHRVYLGDAVAEQGRAHGGGDALAHLQVLDGDGDAVQRPQRPAAGHGVIGGAGVGQRLLLAEGEVGVQPGVQPLDALIEMLGDLHRRHLPRPDGLGKFRGGHIGQFAHNDS